MSDAWEDGPSAEVVLCECGGTRIDQRTPESPRECYRCGKKWRGLVLVADNSDVSVDRIICDWQRA